ncbi:MAG: energy transducer TonB [Nitrospira sp.]|nr:MAG: energy transducer TonB [Nitrospira sp.]
MAFTALLLVKQVQLAPQNDAFKWNVAMVSPAQHVQSTASVQNHAPNPSVPSTTTTPAPQITPAETLSSLQPPAQQPTPTISEHVAPPVLTESLALTSTQPATASRSTAHATPSDEPIKNEAVAPMVAEPTSVVRLADASTAVPGESGAQTVPSDQAPVQMTALSPAPSNPQTKRDYGWLSEAILRRVEELKRYPASARVDRTEGKVVIKAVITEDGNLGEVEVFQSSGYPTLDKAAIDTLRQAAPFHLPHPLGQPRMTIKIPMSYRLDR